MFALKKMFTYKKIFCLIFGEVIINEREIRTEGKTGRRNK